MATPQQAGQAAGTRKPVWQARKKVLTLAQNVCISAAATLLREPTDENFNLFSRARAMMEEVNKVQND